MNIETSELQQLLKVIEEKNLSILEAIDLIKGNSIPDEQVKSEQIKPTEEITLIVDYSKTVEKMIAAGKYDWKNSDITNKHFPLLAELSGQKTAVSKLFHFNRGISSDDVISEMDKAGYRPATLPELLALGEIQPDLQRQFPIIALGSIWHVTGGRRFVSCLRVAGVERELDLLWFGYVWDARCRFLGVRK